VIAEPLACGAAARFKASKLLQADDVHRDVNPVNRERKLSAIATLHHHHYSTAARLPGPLSSTSLATCHDSTIAVRATLLRSLRVRPWLHLAQDYRRSGSNNNNNNNTTTNS
jgi:hypothetical protein